MQHVQVRLLLVSRLATRLSSARPLLRAMSIFRERGDAWTMVFHATATSGWAGELTTVIPKT